MFPPFTKQEREALLQRRREALRQYNQCLDRAAEHPPYSAGEAQACRDAERHLKALEKADAEYFHRLPRLTMSCCPFDGTPLVRTFDAFGLDGLWWRPDATPAEVPSCPHFCALLGAVDFGDRAPRGGEFEAYPGPQAPYVIPRLLEQPGMVAVISQIKMESGSTTYPVAYFAERRPPPQELTAGWARTNFVYTTQLGVSGWQIANDLWDFDLLPWLKAGKVRWCASGSDNSNLADGPPDLCPYLNLPGKRLRTVVRGDHAWTAGVPTGEALIPAISWI